MTTVVKAIIQEVRNPDGGCRTDITLVNEAPRFCGLCAAPYMEREVPNK